MPDDARRCLQCLQCLERSQIHADRTEHPGLGPLYVPSVSQEYPIERISQLKRCPVPFGLVGAGVNMQIRRTQERLDIFELAPGRSAGRPDRYVATPLINEDNLARPNLAVQRPLVDHAVVPGTHEHEVGQAGRRV